MADIKCLNHTRHSQPYINILVGMTTDVEIARHLFHREAASKPASVLFSKGLLRHLELFHLVGFPQ